MELGDVIQVDVSVMFPAGIIHYISKHNWKPDPGFAFMLALSEQRESKCESGETLFDFGTYRQSSPPQGCT